MSDLPVPRRSRRRRASTPAWAALPETHPAAKRSEFHLGQLARTTGRIMASLDFMLLAFFIGMTHECLSQRLCSETDC